MNPHIITSRGARLELDLSPAIVRDHFASPASFAGTILDQINHRRIYQFMFDGRSDLNLIDAGANVGLVSLYASDSCKRIAALEPDPQHFELLCRMCATHCNIFPMRIALTNSVGSCPFGRNSGNTTMNRIVAQSGLMVPCTTITNLLDMLGWLTVDIFKIDIEGGEELAVTPDQVSANANRVRSYYLEVHGTGGRALEQDVAHFCGIFSSSGYQAQPLTFESLFAKRNQSN